MESEANIKPQTYLQSLGLTAANVIVLTYGYLYTVGYLVNAATLRNYGIHHFEAIRPAYLEVGITFTLAVLVPLVVPLLGYIAHFRIRKRASLPNYYVGAIGYLINTCHILYLVFFFCIFMTTADFTVPVEVGPYRFPLYKLCLGYVPPALFSLAGLPILERAVVRRRWSYRFWYVLVIEPVRWFAVLAAVAFQVILFRSIPWIPVLAKKSLAFLACVACLYFGLFGSVYWTRKVARRENMLALTLLVTLGLSFVLYLTVHSYVWGVVRMVPMNRGGKLPVTMTEVFSTESFPGRPSLVPPNRGRTSNDTLGHVFLIEESSAFLYFSFDTSSSWVDEWVPIVAMKKDHVSHMVHRRLGHDSPRLQNSIQPRTVVEE